MKFFKNKYLNYSILGIVSIGSFILIAQLSQSNSELLKNLTQQTGIFGIFFYIILMIISIVIAPVSTGFLLPVAANTWGPFLAAVYSITGWTIGSVIAFYISRKYGLALVGKFKVVKKARVVSDAIPKKYMFWYVVLLRMAFPVEVLSYALGVFSTMKFIPFLLSTIIGIIPFSFMFSYASVASIWIQVVISIIGIISFFTGVYYVYKRSKIIKVDEFL